MSLFREQPGFCCVCGKAGLFRMGGMAQAMTCDETCAKEYAWRTTLYIMGKKYRPPPIAGDTK